MDSSGNSGLELPRSLVRHASGVKGGGRNLPVVAGPLIEGEEDDGYGIAGHGAAMILRVTITDSRREWNIPYGAFLADAGSWERDGKARFSFACGPYNCVWLWIEAEPTEDALRRLELVKLNVQLCRQKTLRAGALASTGEKIIKRVWLQLPPEDYDPLGDLRV